MFEYLLVMPKRLFLGKNVYTFGLKEGQKSIGEFELEIVADMVDEGFGEYDYGGTRGYHSKMAPAIHDWNIVQNKTSVSNDFLLDLLEREQEEILKIDIFDPNNL